MSMSTPCRIAVSPKFFLTDWIVTLAMLLCEWCGGTPALRRRPRCRGSIGTGGRPAPYGQTVRSADAPNLYDDPITMLQRPSPSPAAAPRLVIERLSDRLAALLAAQVESGEPGARATACRPSSSSRRPTASRAPSSAKPSTSSSRAGCWSSRQGSGVYVSKAPRNHALRFDADGARIDRGGGPGPRGAARARRRDRRAGGEPRDAARRSRRCGVRCKAIDKSTAEGGDGVAEDLAFHRALTEAAGNPHFGRLLEFLEQYLRRGDAGHARQRGAPRRFHGGRARRAPRDRRCGRGAPAEPGAAARRRAHAARRPPAADRRPDPVGRTGTASRSAARPARSRPSHERTLMPFSEETPTMKLLDHRRRRLRRLAPRARPARARPPRRPDHRAARADRPGRAARRPRRRPPRRRPRRPAARPVRGARARTLRRHLPPRLRGVGRMRGRLRPRPALEPRQHARAARRPARRRARRRQAEPAGVLELGRGVRARPRGAAAAPRRRHDPARAADLLRHAQAGLRAPDRRLHAQGLCRRARRPADDGDGAAGPAERRGLVVLLGDHPRAARRRRIDLSGERRRLASADVAGAHRRRPDRGLRSDPRGLRRPPRPQPAGRQCARLRDARRARKRRRPRGAQPRPLRDRSDHRRHRRQLAGRRDRGTRREARPEARPGLRQHHPPVHRRLRGDAAPDARRSRAWRNGATA